MKDFNTIEEAISWMYDHVEDSCVDNVRVAKVNNPIELAKYDAQKNKGCCGSYDTKVMVRGKKYYIGCNYGH